jgi:hypothetical protein
VLQLAESESPVCNINFPVNKVPASSIGIMVFLIIDVVFESLRKFADAVIELVALIFDT